MFEQERQNIEAQIQAFCAANGIPIPDQFNWTPTPFAGKWGMTISFFQLAVQEARTGKKVNVPERAEQFALMVAGILKPISGIDKVEAVNGYLNLYFQPSEFTRRVVDTVLDQGSDFGRGSPKNERIMVEYAQPNTHHSFHIGHARNAILGEAMARLVEFAGFNTIRASYPGDIGLGVITVIWAYLKFYRGKEPEGIHNRGQWLLNIYIEATNLLEAKDHETPAEKQRRETYEAERRVIYQRWDQGDPEIRDVWMMTRQWSLDELQDILHMLGIHIDVWFFESEVDELAKQIVEELVRLGIADDERPQNGPVFVKIDQKLGLKKERYRTNILLRSDGTTLYLTKDLALAKIKFEQYQVDRSIYVIDVRQSLHMQQVFKILELWGFPQAEKCVHLGYGFVSLPEGAMSARRGRVVLFKDVADEAERRVLSIIAEKNPGLPQEERQQVAHQIGLGALIYTMLSIDNNRDIVFDMEASLNFEGRTAPYIQNAHVRANSILRKAKEIPNQANFDYDLSTHEISVIDLISRFPEIVQSAAQEYRPIMIANYVYELASAFHSFYHVIPVIRTEDESIRAARLRLVAAARQTLANGLRLIGIEAPPVM
jgi:arginyl-tRNA synthetase